MSGDRLAASAYNLLRDIYAIQLLPAQVGVSSWGPLVRIPKGAVVHLCGAGFNDRTVRVRCNEFFYFVFLEDLDVRRTPATTTSASQGEEASIFEFALPCR